MVSLTDICKAGNKLFGHYNERKATQEYIQFLERKQAENLDIGIPIVKILTVEEGRYGGTWGCEKLALDCAMWCSLEFRDSVYDFILNNKDLLIAQLQNDREQVQIDFQQYRESSWRYTKEPSYTINQRLRDLELIKPHEKATTVDLMKLGRLLSSEVKQRRGEVLKHKATKTTYFTLQDYRDFGDVIINVYYRDTYPHPLDQSFFYVPAENIEIIEGAKNYHNV
jgi:hypothetical protein